MHFLFERKRFFQPKLMFALGITGTQSPPHFLSAAIGFVSTPGGGRPVC
jgi:hypothetical protein